MNINEILNQSKNKLKSAGVENPADESQYLLCHILECDRAFLFAHLYEELKEENATEMNCLTEKRAGNMPFQYITGRQEFMSVRFEVNAGVLIPRPETELLVQSVIDYIKDNNIKEPRILDIGTGSGCIAIILAMNFPNAEVFGCDISEDALIIAAKNAETNNVAKNTRFFRSDIFSNVDNLGMTFDIIISNPPYIPTKDIKSLTAEVAKFEPLRALDGGLDGLDFYKIIISGAPEFLKSEGLIAFEIGIGQHESIKELLSSRYKNIKIIKDYSNIERIIYANLI